MGLEAIHRRGWFHRDITRNNLLFFPGTEHQAPRAEICDFGKICFDGTNRDPYLAHESYLPPEVGKTQEGIGSLYNSKIDIFMLALAITQQWYSDIATPNIEPRFPQRHQYLTTALSNDRRSQLNSLLVKMFTWRAALRPNADECMSELVSLGCIPPAQLAWLEEQQRS